MAHSTRVVVASAGWSIFGREGTRVTVDETERAELIAALHQAATFAEALPDLKTRLLDALTTGKNRPDAEELEYLRAGLSRWREQMAGCGSAFMG